MRRRAENQRMLKYQILSLNQERVLVRAISPRIKKRKPDVRTERPA